MGKEVTNSQEYKSKSEEFRARLNESKKNFDDMIDDCVKRVSEIESL